MALDMLRMEDIINYGSKCLPYLIPFLLLLIVAIVLVFVTKKKTEAKRKLIRSESVIAVLLALALGVTGICMGPMYSSLSLVMQPADVLSDETAAAGKQLSSDIGDEGVVLLKNQDGALPLTEKKLNVFGWASTNPCYGGTGSGGVDSSQSISLLAGLENAGFELNTELSDFYTDYNTVRETGSLDGNTNWTLPEPSADSYTAEMMDNAKAFSDTALIVIARIGGEGDDLPTDMSTVKYITDEPGMAHEGDFVAGQTYLELSKTERDLVDLVTSNFDNVIVLYNGANAFELGWVDEYENIRGVVTVAGPGQDGFGSLGRVLSGEVNPSGRLADTYVYDLTKTYNFNNIGSFLYDNTQEFADKDTDLYNLVSFVNYTEGIYVGYKFYETAAVEGLIDYDTTVQYPFGYGLSYTTFEQKMSDLQVSEDGSVSFDVTVTNTGDVAGKDVVEVYFTPPYTNGGIEKAEVNLLDFGKTGLLDPGASETLTFTFNEEDLASYDDLVNRAYVLEKGTYNISIRSDSHTVLDSRDFVKDSTVVYDQDNPRSTDQIAATNVFDDARGNVTYLSRADHFANYAEATAAPASYSMPDDVKAVFLNNDTYNLEDYNNPDDVMPTTGASNGVMLADLAGKDYDDPLWNDLLDELTVEDMGTLIAKAGFSTIEIPSIGKVATNEIDGPSGLHSFFNPNMKGYSYPAPTTLACTWNKELAHRLGELIGTEASEVGVNGWYGPAMNIHRSAFSGRNFEYYSEDAQLSGEMAAQTVAAAQERGVYCFLKHFALNDQELNRNNQLCVWANEQAIREIYLKAFELPVKEGHATAAMAAFNYIGHEWAGGSSALMKTVLRQEWGFRGMVLTDAALDGYNYINGDQAIRNGTDAILNPDLVEETSVHDQTSATSVLAMRDASHNILYAVANSNAYMTEQDAGSISWETVFYLCLAAVIVVLAVCEWITIRRYRSRKQQS